VVQLAISVGKASGVLITIIDILPDAALADAMGLRCLPAVILYSPSLRDGGNGFTLRVFDDTHSFVECYHVTCFIQSADREECEGYISCVYCILKSDLGPLISIWKFNMKVANANSL
jgi:hypothetical protein